MVFLLVFVIMELRAMYMKPYYVMRITVTYFSLVEVDCCNVSDVDMTTGKTSTATNRVLAMFQEWDNGTKANRGKLLEDFIKNNHNQTGPELELEFAQAASLFFARITAWMRLRSSFIRHSVNITKMHIVIFGYKAWLLE